MGREFHNGRIHVAWVRTDLILAFTFLRQGTRTGYSIGFEHVLTNRVTDDAFRIIEGWLRDEKANIKSPQPPKPNRSLSRESPSTDGLEEGCEKDDDLSADPARPERPRPCRNRATDPQYLGC